jgi:hypothetical protein
VSAPLIPSFILDETLTLNTERDEIVTVVDARHPTRHSPVTGSRIDRVCGRLRFDLASRPAIQQQRLNHFGVAYTVYSGTYTYLTSTGPDGIGRAMSVYSAAAAQRPYSLPRWTNRCSRTRS